MVASEESFEKLGQLGPSPVVPSPCWHVLAASPPTWSLHQGSWTSYSAAQSFQKHVFQEGSWSFLAFLMPGLKAQEHYFLHIYGKTVPGPGRIQSVGTKELSRQALKASAPVQMANVPE